MFLEPNVFFNRFCGYFSLESRYLHIFADPDSGSQKVANPNDPDPKTCSKQLKPKSLYLPVATGNAYNL